HSAFLVLELIRERVQGGETFMAALNAVQDSTIFTTHTPVAAGNDTFPYELIDKYFSDYWGQCGLDREEFHSLAREGQPWGPTFGMTVLALNGSHHRNGVSQLHGRVSRNMWHWLWPNRPVDKVPIEAITNGVHTATWLAPELYDLYSQYLGADWYNRLDDPATWKPIYDVPDEELWALHFQLKKILIDFGRTKLRAWHDRTGVAPLVWPPLDPEALTIGFARRFATYKRATLIFRDLERLKRLLHNQWRPVQLIFAGKAHPADEPGRYFIHEVLSFCNDHKLGGHVAFLENYDMHMAKFLVQGVDIWLNTPRFPLEASGTSGQKAALNGFMNLSVLDGWWKEGYNGANGWGIEPLAGTQDHQAQDEHDAQQLYSILEQEAIPLYYRRDLDGI